MRRPLVAALAFLLLTAPAALSQTQIGGSVLVNGTVTTANPVYQPGTQQNASLDPNGGWRVTCISGCSTANSAIQGQATTAAPTYTTGLAALSLDLAGNVRTLDAADGSVAAGTAGTKSHLIGGIFNSALPTLTNGQQAAAQFDSSGRLIVNVGAGGGSGGTSSNFAAAFPGTGTAIGMSQSGNMVALTGTSNNLNVNCATGCTAASDTSNGPVAAGTAATTSKLAGVQFNTVAPTVANGQQVAMQSDNKGNTLVNLNTPLPAGANVIGQVGGVTLAVTVTPTVTAASYSSGQCVGGLMTFASAARAGGPGSGLVQSATITDISGQDSAIDVIVFNANPSSSTFTDHATCTVNNADLGKVVGVVNVSDCHLLGASAPGVCQGQQQAMPFSLGGGNTTLYAVNFARGTPTYTGTTNISVRIATLPD